MGLFDNSKLIFGEEVTDHDGDKIVVVGKEHFDSFNVNSLGLGNIDSKSQSFESIVVIFDLNGFTNFCNQTESHLQIPEFLGLFLDWMFRQIKEETTFSTYEHGYGIYSKLPFFCKFMGDGVMFIWNTEGMSDVEICNIITIASDICKKYSTEFLKTIAELITSPPRILRCGIARGKVYSVGNGEDFVGSCINIAARLQKFSLLNFCFWKKGFKFRGFPPAIEKLYLTKKVEIRGIGLEELICVRRSEFDKLPDTEKLKFSTP